MVSYIGFSVFFLILGLTNPLIIRNRRFKPNLFDTNTNEQIGFEKNTIEGSTYWKLVNPKVEGKWIIFLHGLWMDSRRNFPKATHFWQHGYSLIFVDARSHGQSKFKFINNGYLYALNVRAIVTKEDIKSPVLFGTSFGATAASIYVAIYPAKGVIFESLPSNFISIYEDFFRYLHMPKFLFGWIPKVVAYIQMKSLGNNNLEFCDPEITLSQINIPIFLMHGEKDKLFEIDKHFYRNLSQLENSVLLSIWLIPEWGHSKLDEHPDYQNKLCNFICRLENEIDTNTELVHHFPGLIYTP